MIWLLKISARKANTMRVTEPRAAFSVAHEDGSETLPPTKVIGCGNFYAGDDAVGPLVSNRSQPGLI